MVNEHITDSQITETVMELEDLATGKATRKWPVSKTIIANRRQDLLNEMYQRWSYDCEISTVEDQPEMPQVLKDRPPFVSFFVTGAAV